MRNTYLQMCDYGSRFRILKGGKISLVISAFIAGTTLLHAAPSGGAVSAGSASIVQSGSVTNITQTTQKAAINWQNFSIGASEVVNFNQPNTNAVILNRVVGNEKSIIDGALNANGQVFILNSNGVLFSKNASVNTAGLVATTMNLSDADFMNGNYNFKGDSTASIINQGTITISDKGYAALFGKEVINEGFIKAILGKVELVGAKEVTLNLNGNSLVNLKVDKGVLDALVENKGAIYADGGEVYLTTNAVDELLKGVVNNTGIVEANSIEDITGKIELFAHGGEADVSGTLHAKDGFVETSGQVLHVSKDVSIKAKEWLLDPTNITIADGGGTDIGGSSMDADVITTALNGGASVTLSADADITVNEAISWSSNKKLTLTAGDEIYVNAAISNTNLSAGGVYFQTTSAYSKVIFGGSGNVVIYNPEQLQWVNTALKGNYTLGSNIDMTGITFVPIGGVGGSFDGFFDGLNHTISNLTITASTTEATGDFQGLFGYAYDPTIQNIGLVNVSITGRDYVGGLVGAMVSTGYVNNCYVTGTGSVAGRDYTGGLIGYQSSNSTSRHNYATLSVSGRGGVGGLVGYSSDCLIDTSYATGRVDGDHGVGGLVGFNAGAGVINQTYSTGYVAATATDNVGGLVGYQAVGTASTNFSFWDDYTSGRTTSAGGTRATTAQMKDNGIYLAAGWSMNGFASGSYPIFRTDGGGVWQIAQSIVYTIPTPSSTYTYTGGSQLPTNWTADVIFGVLYNNWIRGNDYVLKQNGNIITSYTNAGTYENITIDIIKLGYNEASAGNTNGTFTISKAPLTLSANNATKTYGDVNPAFTTTLSGFLAGQTLATSGVSGTGSASSLATATSNVGDYTVTPTIGTLSATNYAVTSFVDGTLSVTPKAITLSAPDVTKIYDGGLSYTPTASELTTLASFLVGGDTLTSIALAFTDKNAGTNNKTLAISNATIEDGNSGSNYAITYTNNTTSTIDKIALTLSGAIASNKVYDGLTSATMSSWGTLNGILSGETVTINSGGATAAFADKNVGTGKTVNITGLALGGANAGNYSAGTSLSATADITRLSSVTWVGGATGNWSLASNWAGGAIPDFSNVADVVIPTGTTVSFDAGLSAPVHVDTISSLGGLEMTAGTLNVANLLSTVTYTQTGGSVVGNAMTVTTGYAQAVGAISMSGDVSITQAVGDVAIGELASNTLSVSTTDGAITQVAGKKITAITSATFVAGGDKDITLENDDNDFTKITLTGNDVSVKDKDNIEVNGMSATGTAKVETTTGNITQTTGSTISVAGATTLIAGGTGTGNGTVTLGSTTNTFGGTVSITGSAATIGATTAPTFGTLTGLGAPTVQTTPQTPPQTNGNAIQQVIDSIIQSTNSAFTSPLGTLAPLIVTNGATPVFTTGGLSKGGGLVSFVSQPTQGEANQRITLSELRILQQSSNEEGQSGTTPVVGDIRIALAQNSLIGLINGGVRLPEGLDQEFYVVEDRRALRR